ncbi:Ig-like domain-containing protein [Candidatus Parcubacteria bacterium]|nr:Ig-like domain-containing protein [Candidatus Parcubacteria bacterium]
MLVKNKKLSKILFATLIVSISFAVFFIFANNFVLAQENFGESQLENINLPRVNLIKSIVKIINYVLGLLGLIAIVIIIYAGFLWMTAGGNANQVDKAKKWLINGLIGLVIIMLSFAITMYVFSVLNKITNDAENGNNIVPNPNPIPTPLPENIFKINSITTSCGSPPNYTQDVHLCSAVVVTFNHHLNKESVNSALNNNLLKIEDCENNSSCDNTLPVDLNNEWATTNKSIIFRHVKDFEKNNFYRINIPKTIQDKTGLVLHPSNACGTGTAVLPGCADAGAVYRWKFKTGETIDEVAPEIVSAYPVLQDDDNYPDRNVNLVPVLQVKFSEAILPPEDAKNNIKIRKITGQVNNDGTGGILADYLLNNDYTVEINSQGVGFEIYDLFFNAFEWYQIEVSEIEDLCNNMMTGTKIWRFQTNDTVPGVKLVYPNDSYTNACPDTSILIVFKTSMYNSENNSCKVMANGQGGGLVISGSLSPSVMRNLQVVDDLPNGANPNDYCKIYEFKPDTVLLNVDQTYTANVKTNLILNQENDKLEKSWSFKIASADECVNAPVITRVSPNFGPDGTCITIFGRYFGDDIGKADLNKNINLDIDTSAWQDKQITTSIPSPSNLDKADNGVKYPIQITTTFQNSELKSNEYDFRLMQGESAKGPCLWSLSPSKGCFDDKITAKGIRFNEQNVDSKIVFTENKLGVIDKWENNKIETKFPTEGNEGNVIVSNSIGASNPVNFDLNCRDQEPKPCSSNLSMCEPDDDLCDVQVSEFCALNCYCKTEPDPNNPKLRITKWWPRNCNSACRNTELGAKFNLALDESSLNNNISVFECQNQDCKKDDLAGQVKIKINYLEDIDSNLFQVDISPENDLKAKTYYRAILNKNIISKDFAENLSSLNYSNTTEMDSFSWVFSTQDKICELNAVDVLPETKTLTKLNSLQKFSAYALGKDLGICDGAPLNAYNYDWVWGSSDNSVASVLDKTEPVNQAKSLANGETNITATTAGLSDFALLTVDTSANKEPSEVKILDFQPTGAQECTNISVSSLFNQKMDTNSLNNGIEIWQTNNKDTGYCNKISLLDNSLNKNFWQKISSKVSKLIKQVLAADEEFEYWCPVEFKINFRAIKYGEKLGKAECVNNKNSDCTGIKILSKNSFKAGEKIKVIIKSGQTGVKGITGGILSQDNINEFNLTNDAQICKISSVEIDPANWTFNKSAETKDFFAQAFSASGVEISTTTDYTWTWKWDEIDEDDIISITDSITDTETVTANNKNGRATLMTTANSSDNTTHTGYAEITNNLCLNPWPASGIYQDNNEYAHLSTFYCRDRGNESIDDDLPAITENPTSKGPVCENNRQKLCNSDSDCLPGKCMLKEYLFLRADGSTDAIGLRIFINSAHLSPQAWYEAQDFSGSPSAIEVANYEAAREGRSVYIAAANLSGAKIYTNIYLLSYNENASQETVAIFNELLKNLQFNTNIQNISDRIKIARDTKRVTDLGAIKKYLNDYFENSAVEDVEKHYPNLLAGSYQIGISTSKWPSWQQTLGKELGKTLPIDPINEFNLPCDTNPTEDVKFDRESCWNDTEKIFVCPDGSHIYQYNSIANATDFNIYATLEYSGDISWINASNSGECWNYIISK